MRYLMFLLVLLFSNVANAIECEKVPDCKELGYSTESDPNCANDGYMYCPFDQDYKVCVQYNCEALGFTESDKTSWCADLIECKGNEKMTLCQKPCFATDYNSLKELASSGKCKVVTMRNDIEMPINESITLHANTIIDGGNHTLNTSVSKENIKNYILRNHTGFRNITLEHKAVDLQKGNSIIFAESKETPISFSNVRFYVTSDVDTVEKTSGSGIIALGESEISDQFEVNVRAKRYYTPFSGGKRHFINADVLLDVKSFGHALFGSGEDFFENSKAQLITNNSPFSHTTSVNIKNSNISIKATQVFYYCEENESGSINLLENAQLTYDMGAQGSFIRQLTGNFKNVQFYLKGTLQNPASLVLNVRKEMEDEADVISSANTTDTLVLNSVTYRPKKAGTTNLSKIETSTDWQKQN